MNKVEREQFLIDLDEELLRGGIILSEWCTVIVQETDLAFVGGADLATIITALAGVETYLRSEYGSKRGDASHKLIDASPLDDDLKQDLHLIRRFRNKWVHVSDPWDDQHLLDRPHEIGKELASMAEMAVRALRRTIYENQWI